MDPQTPCHFRNLPPSLNNQPYCLLLKLLVKYPPVVLYFHATPPKFSFYITNLSVCPLNRGRFSQQRPSICFLAGLHLLLYLYLLTQSTITVILIQHDTT